MKKLFFLIVMCVCSCAGVMAQSMTDDQLIRYVLQEKENGTDQEVIVRNLLQRGVTMEQLRRVRKKVEAQQKQLGAKDLTGVDQQQGRNRLRTRQQVAQDERQKQQGFMIRSQREEEEWRYLPREQRMQMIEGESDYFDLDSLDYYSSLIPKDQQVYGRNIFNQKNLSFEPNMNMATPANYRLGAGDGVIIDVWGASQETFTGTISPDGIVTIEGVGPVKLAGLSVSEATSRLKARIGQYYSDCQVSLSLGETRSIIVQVMGEVNMPGSYTLSSLATAFNALYAAGGISNIGTLRDIEVYRGGRVISRIDVYDYLLHGNSKGDVRLQDNDVIRVGTYDALVEVRGKVKRPMFYEMRSGESVQRVLEFAGGFTGDAYTKSVRLIRKAGQEYSIHNIEEFDMNGFTLADGDSLFVDSVTPRFRNMVEVRGSVMHPGMFQMDGKIQTVRDLLTAAEGVREDAFTERAVMHREKEDLTLEMISLNIKGILDGTAADVPLKKNDILFVPSTIDMKGEQTLAIQGEVLYPGEYHYADNTSVEDLVLMAGGLTPGASTVKVDVYRRIIDTKALENTIESTQVFSVSLTDGLRAGEGGFKLQPYDLVVIRKSPVYNKQQNVRIEGCVNFEGVYAMSTKEYRLSDLVKAAGGLSAVGYAKGARLTRRMTEEERIQRENSLRAAQIQMYEEAMQSDKEYNMAQADTLISLKLDVGETYPMAINLDEAIKHPGGPADIVMRENDILTIPQFSNTVKVSGEVVYPISMSYSSGKKLSYYIKRAGGYGNRAKKKGAYAIYMSGAVEKIDRSSSKSIEPGCEIVIPTKKQRNRMSTGEVMSIASGTASLASVVVALISILK